MEFCPIFFRVLLFVWLGPRGTEGVSHAVDCAMCALVSEIAMWVLDGGRGSQRGLCDAADNMTIPKDDSKMIPVPQFFSSVGVCVAGATGEGVGMRRLVRCGHDRRTT